MQNPALLLLVAGLVLAACLPVCAEEPCAPVGVRARSDAEGTTPTVTLTEFTSLQRLFWNPLPELLGYNVYIRDSEWRDPQFNGRCLFSAVPENSVLLDGEPGAGQVWMFQVTALSGGGEGPMGETSGCASRTPEAPCVCTLPADEGPCDSIVPRWFHNVATGACEEFIWGGCEGNANNFETHAECEDACLEVCDQPAVTGECDAAFPRWYHSVLSGHCEGFIWGGCGGNDNNFVTEESCRNFCGDICWLPPDVGDCDGVCPRWFFNPDTDQCEEFVWGCCGGNANNFATQADCEADCP